MKDYLVHFALSQYFYVLCFVTFWLLLFFAVNLFYNVYGKDNARLLSGIKQISKVSCGERDKSTIVAPSVYKPQFNAFKKTVCCLPSEVFLFVPRPQHLKLFFSTLLFVTASLFYPYVYFFTKAFTKSVYFLTPILFCVFFLGFILICKYKQKADAKHAVKLMEKWVFALDLAYGKNENVAVAPVKQSEVDKTVEKMNLLESGGISKQNAEKLSSLLTPDWLNKDRTVEQQRQLNTALNKLVTRLSDN